MGKQTKLKRERLIRKSFGSRQKALKAHMGKEVSRCGFRMHN